MNNATTSTVTMSKGNQSVVFYMDKGSDKVRWSRNCAWQPDMSRAKAVRAMEKLTAKGYRAA